MEGWPNCWEDTKHFVERSITVICVRNHTYAYMYTYMWWFYMYVCIYVCGDSYLKDSHTEGLHISGRDICVCMSACM